MQDFNFVWYLLYGDMRRFTKAPHEDWAWNDILSQKEEDIRRCGWVTFGYNRVAERRDGYLRNRCRQNVDNHVFLHPTSKLQKKIRDTHSYAGALADPYVIRLNEYAGSAECLPLSGSLGSWKVTPRNEGDNRYRIFNVNDNSLFFTEGQEIGLVVTRLQPIEVQGIRNPVQHQEIGFCKHIPPDGYGGPRGNDKYFLGLCGR